MASTYTHRDHHDWQAESTHSLVEEARAYHYTLDPDPAHLTAVIELNIALADRLTSILREHDFANDTDLT
jgi:hypothetical protein